MKRIVVAVSTAVLALGLLVAPASAVGIKHSPKVAKSVGHFCTHYKWVACNDGDGVCYVCA